MREGAAADEAVAESSRRTASRRELARHERFDEVSPEVGQLDEEALQRLMAEDPDEALALLADLTGRHRSPPAGAGPPAGRADHGRRGRRGRARQRGVGRILAQPFQPEAGDLDLDASLEALAVARATAARPTPRTCGSGAGASRGTALCLVVDRSGSMGGRPLATAALAAAAVAHRAPDGLQRARLRPGRRRGQGPGRPQPAAQVVTDVLALRGFGTTDLVGALKVATTQLQRSQAGRRVAVLLSDCRATVPGDVVAAARGLDELVIVAPAADAEEARELAASVGARFATVDGPSQIPEALADRPRRSVTPARHGCARSRRSSQRRCGAPAESDAPGTGSVLAAGRVVGREDADAVVLDDHGAARAGVGVLLLVAGARGVGRAGGVAGAVVSELGTSATVA